MDNRLLGVFQVGNTSRRRRAACHIESDLRHRCQRILQRHRQDRATNNEQKITITSSSGPGKDEVEKMARDAETHGAEDRSSGTRSRPAIAPMRWFTTWKNAEGSPLQDRRRGARSRSGARSYKKAMAENDPDRINSTTDRLTTASHKLAEAMYKASSQPGAGAAPGGDGGGFGSGARSRRGRPK